MPRTIALSQSYCRSVAALRPQGDEAKALAATIRSLERATSLPTVFDAEMALPPVHWCWFRRVSSTNFWLLFDFDDDKVYLRRLVNRPPVPVIDL